MVTKVAEKKSINLELPLYSKEGKKTTQKVTVSADLFGTRVNKRLLDIVLTSYGANQRRGTHKTKERAEVRGGGKKPWKQKGTGRARAGSSRSPLWRGGGTTFGPRPRDYSTQIPKVLRQKALVSALSLKLREGTIKIVADITSQEAKTREVASVLMAMDVHKGKALCVLPAIDEKLRRASKNLNLFSVKDAAEVSAYHVMRRKNLLIGKEALILLEQRLLGGGIATKEAGKDEKDKVSV